MGYNLINSPGNGFSCTNRHWTALLNIAKNHGWKPEGTGIWENDGQEVFFVKDPERGETGEYTACNGKKMSWSDMDNMLKALNKAAKKKELKDQDGFECSPEVIEWLAGFHESTKQNFMDCRESDYLAGFEKSKPFYEIN